jgi:flagellar biosynthesis/type III secretory pathway chaperone
MDNIKQTITKGNAEQLNQLLAQQPDEFSKVESVRQECTDILTTHGYADNENGLKQFIQGCTEQPLKELYATLNKEIDQLKKSLLVNDLIVRKNQQRVRQTLQILSGHQVTTKSNTYSRQGNTDQQDGEKRSIALA